MTVPWKSIDLGWVERRLRSASDSTESVHTLSAWALKNKDHYELIVDVWLKVLKTVPAEKKVILFYLVNEVIQTCHRKNALEYKDCFKKIFTQAIPFVRLPEIKSTIERILNVWLTREVYEASFVNQLLHILNNETTENGQYLENVDVNDNNSPYGEQNYDEDDDDDDDDDSDIVEDVKAVDVRVLIMRVKRLEDDLSLLEDEGFHFVPEFNQIDTDAGEVSADILERLNLFVSQLDELVSTREKLLVVLNSASCILHLEAKEANIVASAYKNYSARINTVKHKLSERINFLKLKNNLTSNLSSNNEKQDAQVATLDQTSSITAEMDHTVGILKSEENKMLVKPPSENNLSSLLNLFKKKSLESIETIPVAKEEGIRVEVPVSKVSNVMVEEKMNIVPDKDFMKDPMSFLNRLLAKPNKAPSLPDIFLPPITSSQYPTTATSSSSPAASTSPTIVTSPTSILASPQKITPIPSPSDQKPPRSEDTPPRDIRTRFRKRKISVTKDSDFQDEDKNNVDKKMRSDLDDRISKLLKGDAEMLNSGPVSSPESESFNKSPNNEVNLEQIASNSVAEVKPPEIKAKVTGIGLKQSITYNSVMNSLPQTFPYYDVEMLSGIFRIIENEDGSKELFQMPAEFDQSQFLYEEQFYIKPADSDIQQALPNPFLLPPPIPAQTPYPIITKPPPMAPIYHSIPPPILPQSNPYINPMVRMPPPYQIPAVVMHYQSHLQPNTTIVHVNMEGLKRIEKVKSTRASTADDYYREREAQILDASSAYRPKLERKSILTEIKQVSDNNIDEPQKIRVHHNRSISNSKSSLIALTEGNEGGKKDASNKFAPSRFKVKRITDDDIIRANVIAIKTDDKKAIVDQKVDVRNRQIEVIRSSVAVLSGTNQLVVDSSTVTTVVDKLIVSSATTTTLAKNLSIDKPENISVVKQSDLSKHLNHNLTAQGSATNGPIAKPASLNYNSDNTDLSSDDDNDTKKKKVPTATLR